MHLKETIRNFRDKLFLTFERFILSFFNLFNLKFFKCDTTILVVERNGRYDKESLAEISFGRSLQKFITTNVPAHNLLILRYNNVFWLKDSIKMIALVAFGKVKQIIYTQRMSHHIFPSMRISSFCKNKQVFQINFWMDSHNQKLWKNMIIPNSKNSDLAVFFDNPNLNFVDKVMFPNSFFSFAPYEIPTPKVSFSSKLGVCFSGRANNLSEHTQKRENHLKFLSFNNIKINGWPKTNNIDYETYLSVIQHSLIGLNFSWYDSDETVNGRIAEILMCETLLIQSKNATLSKYLYENQHFISFENKYELLDKVKYFLENRLEAFEMAIQGRQRYLEVFNNTAFWKRVFHASKPF